MFFVLENFHEFVEFMMLARRFRIIFLVFFCSLHLSALFIKSVSPLPPPLEPVLLIDFKFMTSVGHKYKLRLTSFIQIGKKVLF